MKRRMRCWSPMPEKLCSRFGPRHWTGPARLVHFAVGWCYGHCWLRGWCGAACWSRAVLPTCLSRAPVVCRTPHYMHLRRGTLLGGLLGVRKRVCLVRNLPTAGYVRRGGAWCCEGAQRRSQHRPCVVRRYDQRRCLGSMAVSPAVPRDPMSECEHRPRCEGSLCCSFACPARAVRHRCCPVSVGRRC
jgi:hypothetical protein